MDPFRFVTPLLVVLLGSTSPAVRGAVPPRAETTCPACGHILSFGPPPPEPQGEGDLFLCRWDLGTVNPYAETFVTCRRCGFTLMREHFPVPDSWLKNPPTFRPPPSGDAGEELLVRADNAAAFYFRPVIPAPVQIKAAWSLVCALHRHNFLSPRPKGDQVMQKAWNMMRSLGMSKWPVWRWYEALGYFFEGRFHRSGNREDRLTAAEFFRRIGRFDRARRLLAIEPETAAAHRALELEAVLRGELVARASSWLFRDEKLFCRPRMQSLGYIIWEQAVQEERWQDAVMLLERFQRCPALDPVLTDVYLIPGIRRAWLESDRGRAVLTPWLDAFTGD